MIKNKKRIFLLIAILILLLLFLTLLRLSDNKKNYFNYLNKLISTSTKIDNISENNENNNLNLETSSESIIIKKNNQIFYSISLEMLYEKYLKDLIPKDLNFKLEKIDDAKIVNDQELLILLRGIVDINIGGKTNSIPYRDKKILIGFLNFKQSRFFYVNYLNKIKNYLISINSSDINNKISLSPNGIYSAVFIGISYGDNAYILNKILIINNINKKITAELSYNENQSNRLPRGSLINYQWSDDSRYLILNFENIYSYTLDKIINAKFDLETNKLIYKHPQEDLNKEVIKIANYFNCNFKKERGDKSEIDCYKFIEKIFYHKIPIPDEIIFDNNKLSKYFLQGLTHPLGVGVEKIISGYFDKYLNSYLKILIFKITEPNTEFVFSPYELFVILLKDNNNWIVKKIIIPEDYDKYLNIDPRFGFKLIGIKQLVKNEPPFFIVTNMSASGSCVGGGDHYNILRLENFEMKLIWRLENYSYESDVCENAEKLQTKIEFEDLDNDGNYEIVQKGYKILCNTDISECNKDNKNAIKSMEEIYNIFEWSEVDQTFIEKL